jgi:GH15 family glucan-1,4-alpha-glucosidase
MNSLNLAVIGNCAISALIDRSSDLVWSCFPRIDGDPVFCALVDGQKEGGKARDRRNGVFYIRLVGMARCDQHYIDNTAVLVSVQSDAHGNAVEITDFAPRFEQYERMFRPPTLIRRVRPLKGRPRIQVRVKPMFDWGSQRPQITRGSNHMRFVGPQQALRLTSDAPISYVVEEQPFIVDRPISFFFGADETLDAEVEPTSRRFLERTIDEWQGWARALSIPFDWQDAVIRAAITLKLCNFEETGAIVAALTTSIPEAPNTQRNWDYRYCWLRDAYFVIQALNRLGVTHTMEDYISFIANAVADTGSAELQPLYSITRGAVLEETEATDLAGYKGMGPVRVGNAAYMQTQNDVYGSVVLAATHSFFDRRMTHPGNGGLYEQLEQLGERAALAFDQPDAGVWELRTRTAVHTFSSVMCWAACDRLAKIAGVLGMTSKQAKWRSEAKRLHTVIMERTWNAEIDSFVSTFDGRELDATLLLLHELGFLPASDPRIVSTIDAVGKALRRGDLLLRYATEDDFGRPASAFLICAFWYTDALNAIGRRNEARELFERILALRNSFGLFSEDIDVASGDLWGNFPQTYSMVGLINSAMRLSRSWEEAF